MLSFWLVGVEAALRIPTRNISAISNVRYAAQIRATSMCEKTFRENASGLMVQWYHIRFACGRHWFQFPVGPFRFSRMARSSLTMPMCGLDRRRPEGNGLQALRTCVFPLNNKARFVWPRRDGSVARASDRRSEGHGSIPGLGILSWIMRDGKIKYFVQDSTRLLRQRKRRRGKAVNNSGK
jgi:hypothetical protein